MLKITDYNEPHVLNRNALLLQAKINKRNKDAMIQREMTPELLPTKAQADEVRIDDDRPDVIANKFRKAEILKAQFQKIAKNAIVDDLGFTPTKIQSDVSQQMIAEYQAEQQQPIKITNDDGTVSSFKYHPVNIDTSLEAPKILKEFTLQEKRIMSKAQTDLARDSTNINRFLSRMDEFRQNIAD